MKLTAPKQRQGEYFEKLAKLYLEAQGLIFIVKNWHYKNLGELDLVMLDSTNPNTPSTLVFIEVRQRKISHFGSSLDSITPSKQRKIFQATQAFLQAHPQFDACDIRFDVVSFDANNPKTDRGVPIPNWITNAFYPVE